MLRVLILPILLFFATSTCFKILVSVPKFGFSHMQTMGKLADILVENGHEVVRECNEYKQITADYLQTFLMPVCVPIPQNGTELAKVVLVPPSQWEWCGTVPNVRVAGEQVIQIMEASMKSGAVANLWTHSANSKQGIMWSTDMIGQVSYHNTKSEQLIFVQLFTFF